MKNRLMYVLCALVALGFGSSTFADQDAHTLRIIHDISQGFAVTTASENGTDYTMIHNGYAQVIIERPPSFPPLQTSSWTSGSNSHLELSFGGDLGYGCATGWCRFIDMRTRECVQSACENACMICYGKVTPSLEALEFGPGPF